TIGTMKWKIPISIVALLLVGCLVYWARDFNLMGNAPQTAEVKEDTNINSLEEYDARLNSDCRKVQQEGTDQRNDLIAKCKGDATCIKKVEKENLPYDTQQFFAACAYAKMFNDERATGSIRMYAQQEQYAIDRREAQGKSDSELKTEIKSGLSTLIAGYDM